MVYYLSEETWIGEVFFVNPSIWFEQSLRAPLQEFSSLRKAYWRACFPHKVRSNIKVYTPVYIPKCAKWTELYINHLLATYTNTPYILLINGVMPRGVDLDKLTSNSVLSIYDWSDDFAQFAGDEDDKERVQKKINHFIKSVDIVFTVNEKLLKRALKINTNSYPICNGTNLAMFHVRMQPKQKNSRPVIGYAGWLVPDRLDVELIHMCAKTLPEYDFVFVGPKVEKDPLRLCSAPTNIYYKKPVPFEELPNVINSFDICILPNNVNSYTDGNDPIKFYDYLYLGKPIVTTRTAGADKFLDIVDICDNYEDFCEAIVRRISCDDSNLVWIRQQYGIENSWANRIKEVIKIITKNLAL